MALVYFLVSIFAVSGLNTSAFAEAGTKDKKASCEKCAKGKDHKDCEKCHEKSGCADCKDGKCEKCKKGDCEKCAEHHKDHDKAHAGHDHGHAGHGEAKKEEKK